MNIDSLFSALSFVAVIVYTYIGFYAYKQNKTSLVHRTFLLLCISYAIWSFAYAFVYVSVNPHTVSFWNKISALGWCSFSALTLYLVLLITGIRLLSRKAWNILLFAPAFIFYYMAVFLFGPDIETPSWIMKLFYIGNFLYNFTCLLSSILILFIWGRKSQSIRIKKQAKILTIAGIIPFCLNLMSQTILPLFTDHSIPLMGQLYAVIMILGTYIVISKYRFLKVPDKVVLEEIQDKILDMVIVLNSRFEMIRISKHALELLNYEERDLINKNAGCLFDDKPSKIFNIEDMSDQEIKYEDIEMAGNGIKIPANILFIPIFDDRLHDFLGGLLIMQDIRIEHELRLKNVLLYEKTIRDSMTNLYNYQFMFEVVKDYVNRLNDGNKFDLSLMMIDIDYFKRVNDTFGHLFGDYVLHTVAEILTDMIGEDGYVGRYGGEEFVVLLPFYNIEKAYNAGERIRERIERNQFDHDLKITVSIGIKQYRNESYDQLVNSADALLYKAKQRGRNQIAV
jgi:diguanylate cyclase (GGDEF) domain